MIDLTDENERGAVFRALERLRVPAEDRDPGLGQWDGGHWARIDGAMVLVREAIEDAAREIRALRAGLVTRAELAVFEERIASAREGSGL